MFEIKDIIIPEFGEILTSDPTIIKDKDIWHLFCWSFKDFNVAIAHYESKDLENWKKLGYLTNKEKKIYKGFLRPFILKDEDSYYLLSQEVRFKDFDSQIDIQESKDLENWSEPAEIKIEKFKGDTAGNPCIVKLGNIFRLYFSYDKTFTMDISVLEPKKIGYAEADNIYGPYYFKKDMDFSDIYNREHIISNGAIRIRKINGEFYAANNLIYRHKGINRSEIYLLKSTDAENWELVTRKPIAKPEYRKKIVAAYAADLAKEDDKLIIPFNKREDQHLLHKKKFIFQNRLQDKIFLFFTNLFFIKEKISLIKFPMKSGRE